MAKKKDNPPILLYREWRTFFANLTAEDAGNLIKSIYAITDGEEPENLSPAVLGIFQFISQQVLNDQDKYKSKCDTQQANAMKRYENKAPKVATASHGTKESATANHGNININTNTNINTNISIDKEKNIKEKAPRTFTRPTLAQVEAYVLERGNKMSASAFFNFYEANGWKVGKNSMKDWRAAVRSWEGREGDFKKPAHSTRDIIAELSKEAEELDNTQIFKPAGSDSDFDLLGLFGGE